MAETFSVGEVALFVREGSDYSGAECTIIGPLSYRFVRDRKDGATSHKWVYLIDGPFDSIPGTRGFVAAPENLRKRRPPQDWKTLCNLTDTPREMETA